MSDELSLCVNCDREYRSEMQDVCLCPACEAKVTQHLREDLAMTKALLALAEAQRDSLRKRYLQETA